MNLNTVSIDRLARLARLHQAPEFPVLMRLLQEELARVTRDAIRSADPQLCGMAQALGNLVETLDDIPVAFNACKNGDQSLRDFTSPANT
jgi:hypothetical protein